jgi:hypothetical protein
MRITAFFVVVLTVLSGCGSSSRNEKSDTSGIKLNDPKLAGLEKKLNEDSQLLPEFENAVRRFHAKVESANRLSEVMDFIEKEAIDLAAKFPSAEKEIKEAIPIFQKEAAKMFIPYTKADFRPLMLKMESSPSLKKDIDIVLKSLQAALSSGNVENLQTLPAKIDEVGVELIKIHPTCRVEIQLAIDALKAYFADLIRLI